MSNIMNMSALSSHRQSLVNQQLLQASMRQLSSGQRINSAADDAAGLAISEKMRAQQTMYERAMMNAQDGASMTQVAEGALGSVHDMLNRLTDLSVQAANGTMNSSQRDIINGEAQSLLDEINRISEATNFNGISLLNGSLSSADQIEIGGMNASVSGDSLFVNRADMQVFDGTNADSAAFSVNGQSFVLADAANYDDALASFEGSGTNVIQVEGNSGAALTATDMENISQTVNETAGLGFEAVAGGMAMKVGQGLQLQVGASADNYNTITVSVGNMSAQGLGLAQMDLSTQAGASRALDMISAARERVSSTRSDLGATQNRLDSTYNNLAVQNENITAAESRVRDLDMAKAMMDLTRRSILGQVSNSMMAQTNMQQGQVLQLLR